MVKLGFIGYGSMGSMLINAFIKSGKIAPHEITVSTRTRAKLDGLKDMWSNINIAERNEEVPHLAKYVFICVKPSEFKGVLSEIRAFVTPNTNIISIAGSVPITYIEELTGAKVTKLTPSLTSEVLGGISLICHGGSVLKDEAEYLEDLLSGISTVKKIKEEDFELSAELTSCMPGFIASIFQEMTESGTRHTDSLSKEDIEEMILRTLMGTAKLFIEKNMGFEEMVERVATKGGITEEGVRIFRKKLPEVFDEMFDATLAKRKVVTQNVISSFKVTNG